MRVSKDFRYLLQRYGDMVTRYRDRIIIKTKPKAKGIIRYFSINSNKFEGLVPNEFELDTGVCMTSDIEKIQEVLLKLRAAHIAAK